MQKFKGKYSTWDSQKSEELSIKCLIEILSICNDVKPHLTINDKSANTDGWIELLNENTINGNITVQVKTLAEDNYLNPKFPCPSSLFRYAQECPNELVFLIVVNNKDCIAYWKNIDQNLIEKNIDKYLQESITLHFEEADKIDTSNANKIIQEWKNLKKNKFDLILNNGKFEKENEELKSLFKKFQNPNLTLERAYIAKIQDFIDEYNHLLDDEFNFIKKVYFPNAWKIGIAFSEFSATRISYVIYQISKGENGLLIRQIPIEEFLKIKSFVFASRNLAENAIYINPKKFAFKLIKDNINKFLKDKKVLLITEEIGNEYIFGFINRNYRVLKIEKQKNSYNLDKLKIDLESNFPRIEQMPCSIISSGKNLDVSILYSSVVFLLQKSIHIIERLYPEKGNYGDTGLVIDFYSPELAFSKFKYLYERIPNLFNSFIKTNFPQLRNEINFFGEFSLIIANLSYQNGQSWDDCNINLYYFTSNGNIENKKLLISLNYELEALKINRIGSRNDLIEKCFTREEPFIYKDCKYSLIRVGGESLDSLYDDFYIHNMLYKYLNDRFNEYFKKKQ